jgi:thiol-disulfide isomerase/thioredoxin
VNFWATWCKPCVKELPAFEKLNEVYANDKVKVLLVSLDFIKHFETKVKPFVAEKNLKSDVILLNDPRSNQWIDKVSKEWSGAIPATVIYRGKDRLFYEGSFTYEELEKEMLKIHKP